METKKSFVIYSEWASLIANLPTEQAGELIKAMCMYQQGIEPEISDTTINAVYVMIRQRMEEDAKAYSEKCAKAKAAIQSRYQKGSEPTSSGSLDSVRSNTDVEKRVRTQGDNDNENDNDNSKDKRERREKRTSRFSPPTPDEITRYAASVNLRIDVSAFYDYYSMRNWHLTNGDEMTDWKAAVRNWVRRDKDDARKKAASKTKKSSFCGYSHEDTDYNAMGLLLMQRQRQKDDHPPELQDSG